MTSAAVMRALTAFDYELVQRILDGAEHPAGIGELESEVLPDHGMGQHVAGGARNGRDDGPPGAGQTVEQRGLAHVGAADEHDGGQALDRHGKCRPYLTGSQGLVALGGCRPQHAGADNPMDTDTCRFDSVSDTK